MVEDRNARLLGGLPGRLITGDQRQLRSLHLSLALKQTHARQIVQFRPAVGQHQCQSLGADLPNLASHSFETGIG